MKKVIFALAVVFVFFSCSNGDETSSVKESNPYPDGVYPFEVSNLGYKIQEYPNGDRYFLLTWDNPTDGGFKKVNLEYSYVGQKHLDPENTIDEYILLYSSVTGKGSDFLVNAIIPGDVIFEKNKFSYELRGIIDTAVIIKCVDKFGNTSNGIKYIFRISDFEVQRSYSP